MPAPAVHCPNCHDVTLDNGGPAVAATPTTPAVAATPPDARCPSCTMRVQDTGVAGPLWPMGIPTGTPPNFAVDPATGAVRLPTGVLTPPWVAAPTPIAPAPTAVTPTAPPWYKRGEVWAAVAGIGVTLAAVVAFGVWAIRGDVTDRPPRIPEQLSADPSPDDPCHGACARGTRCVPPGDWGPATCVADPGANPPPGPAGGGFNPPIPGGPAPVNQTVTIGGDVPVVTQGTPPQPQPTCTVATHPRPLLFDLAATGSDGVTIAANGAPQDCEVPPNGIITPWVDTGTVPPRVNAWYCCTPEVRQAAR